MLKLKLQYFGPPDAKSRFIRKDPDDGKDWGQEEKGTTEDEMVGWHHQLDGHEFEQALGNGDRQGSLVCCSPWGRKESDMTDNWTTTNNVDEPWGHDAQGHRPNTEGTHTAWSTYLRFLEKSDPRRLRVVARDGGKLFNRYRLRFATGKSPGDGQWWWLHNSANVLNVTEGYIQNG